MNEAKPQEQSDSRSTICSSVSGGDPATRKCLASTLHDEFVMSQFIAMCAESLSPDNYESVLDACRMLSTVRTNGLQEDSVDRCMQAAFEYLDSLKMCG